MVVSHRTLNTRISIEICPKLIAPAMVPRYKHLYNDSEGIRRFVEQMVMFLSLVTGNKIRCRNNKLSYGSKAVFQYYG